MLSTRAVCLISDPEEEEEEEEDDDDDDDNDGISSVKLVRPSCGVLN